MKLKLKEMLNQKDVSQYRLAQITGLKRQFINRIANEQPPKISVATVWKLCAALECQPGDLLEYTRNE